MTTLERLDVAAVERTLVAFRDALISHREAINALNVYPVPDGDTGTNMSLTLRSVVEELEGAEPDAKWKAINHGSLMGARGNSGVILSQILRALSDSLAAADDIDAGMVLGCNHPMGPLALADLIGLDTTMAVAESLYEEFKEQLYATPPLLNRMCDAGLLGRKSGRGFYTYDR